MKLTSYNKEKTKKLRKELQQTKKILLVDTDLRLLDEWVQLNDEEDYHKYEKRFKAFIKELSKVKIYSGNTMME